MQVRSRPSQVSLLLLFVLLTAGSAAAGAFLSTVRSAADPLPVRQEATLEARPMLGFPDAAVLQERFFAGEIDGAHPLTAAGLDALQAALDELNLNWHRTTVELHARMELVTDELIVRGELQPALGARFAPRGDVIGGRLVVRDGVAYEKDFYPGEDARIDMLDRRRALLTHFAYVVVRRAFN